MDFRHRHGIIDSMFGIGIQEMLIILVVVLIVFGPKRLPDLAKSLGKGIAEFRKASDEVKKGIEEAVKEEEEPPPAAATRTSDFPIEERSLAAYSGEAPPSDAPASDPPRDDASHADAGTDDAEPPVPPRQG